MVMAPRAVRAVDDVAPALRNATAAALSSAKTVVREYQDLLFAIAMRKLVELEVQPENSLASSWASVGKLILPERFVLVHAT
jgi:hypothetical protein